MDRGRGAGFSTVLLLSISPKASLSPPVYEILSPWQAVQTSFVSLLLILVMSELNRHFDLLPRTE